MQDNWCLQSMRAGHSSDIIIASSCKKVEFDSDNDKNYYPQLWLFEQVSYDNNIIIHSNIELLCVYSLVDQVVSYFMPSLKDAFTLMDVKLYWTLATVTLNGYLLLHDDVII